VITAGAWILCGWRPGLPARGTGVRPMLRFALNTYGNYVVSYLGRTIDKMLIGRFQGSQLLGNYDRAYQLSLMLPNQLLSPLSTVAMSAFSRLSDDPEKYCHVYLRVLSIIAFVSIPLSAALTLVGQDLILLLLGPQWNKAGQIFTVFGLSIGVSMLYYTHAWLHLSLGTPDRWLRWGIIAFMVTVLFFVIGLRFGALGVAVAYSASFYILIGPALWYAGRPIHLKLSSVLSGIWKYFVSALAAGSLCWFILYKFDLTSNIFMEFNIFIRIVISFALCILIYLSLVIVFYQNVKPMSQFISILREMVPKISADK
jgi:PST family polysaccharide transporter